MTGQIEQYLEQEIASLKQQLAEAKKDAERMRDALVFLKDEATLTSSQYEVIRQAMREGE